MTTDDLVRLKKERQLIGIARRALGIDPDTHAAIVRRITADRCASTTECTLGELLQIKGEYQRAGWQATPHKGTPRPLRPAPDPASPGRSALDGTGPMLQKIAALLAELRKTWGYAAGIYRQQKGLPKGVAAPLELATAQDLRAIIAALSRHRQRQAALAPSPPAGEGRGEGGPAATEI